MRDNQDHEDRKLSNLILTFLTYRDDPHHKFDECPLIHGRTTFGFTSNWHKVLTIQFSAQRHTTTDHMLVNWSQLLYYFPHYIKKPCQETTDHHGLILVCIPFAYRINA